MNPWRVFRVVFAKEMRELVRDRKTLFWLLAPPIILPGIALLAALFIGTQTARYVTQGFPVTVINGQAAPGLVASLKRSSALIVTERSSDTEHTDLITLTVPDNFQQQIDAGKQAHLILTQRDNTFVTTLALGAVRSEVDVYSNALLDQRLKTLGQDRAWLKPINLEETQVAIAAQSVTATEPGKSTPVNGLSAIFLPLAVTSWLVGGGLGLIVDTTVGEKERQTIESVLVTPASRVGVVLGKLCAVFIASLVVMGMWMIEGMFLSLVGDIGPKLMAQGGAPPDIGALIAQSGQSLGSLIVILILLLVPFIVVLNSLVMAFCSYAGSYRESNVFLFLLQLVLPALVLLSVFSVGPDAGIGWYAAPILGTIIAIRDLFSQTLVANGLILAVASTSIYAIGALALASYIYSREWALVRGI
ncbi:MAG: ABC transporter permease [Anaerolineae bacterium]|nr:ABC transporter permease [Anaerolineae bacterium]